MKNKPIESSILKKDYEKHIEEYNGRHFDNILKEFSDCPLRIWSFGESRYPLDMNIETSQGKSCLFFEDLYVIEACFYPRKSS